jgi:hypothetical protein
MDGGIIKSTMSKKLKCSSGDYELYWHRSSISTQAPLVLPAF